MKKLTLALLALTYVVAPAWSEAVIGSKAPRFEAKTSEGKSVQLSAFDNQWVVLEWVNFDCPFVRRQYDSEKMQNLQKKWGDQGVVWLSVCSSAPGKQGYLNAQDMQQKLQAEKSNAKHMILDPEGKLGRLYGAKTTPHMFVVDPKGNVIYAGAIDDKREVNYVEKALTEAKSGKKVSQPQTQAYGCGVKYSD